MSDALLPATLSALLPEPASAADVLLPPDNRPAAATSAPVTPAAPVAAAGEMARGEDQCAPESLPGALPRLDALETAAAAVASAVAELAAEQHSLVERVGAAVRLAEKRETTIDRLATENAALRAAEREGQSLPIFRDLVALYDGLDGLAGRYASAGDSRVAGDVGTMRDLVTDLLARYGVETYAPEVGESVQPKAHRTVRTVPGAAEQHLTVASVLRVGFRTEARVVRVPEVAAYRCEPDRPGASPAGSAIPSPAE